ncbi:hypothetical protein FB451DRAFT_1370402 [Mycena latifolia]|nr:hypothetical protein FB451DRAFT_1370402 [Mycena latifolia]
MQVPSFPLELEREILEMAAYRDRALIPTLLLVCRRVHTWIEPLLYRVIVVEYDVETRLLAVEAAMESKPARFLQTTLRHLYLSGLPSRMPRYKNLLEHCPGIINLFLDVTFTSDLLPALSIMRLQKLAISVPFPSSLRLDHSLFLSVTHLDIYADDLDNVGNWDEWSPLASLPVLTHLCLSDQMSNVILPQVVADCSKLLVVLILVDFSMAEEFSNALTVTDPRLVVTSVVDYVADWERGAWGGDDMWARADEFLARKRLNEIPSTSFLSPRHRLSSSSALEVPATSSKLAAGQLIHRLQRPNPNNQTEMSPQYAPSDLAYIR